MDRPSDRKTARRNTPTNADAYFESPVGETRNLFLAKTFTSQTGSGFICRAPVTNVDFPRSSGIRAHSRGIAVSRSWTDPEIRIAPQKPAVLINLARPGVAVGLQSPSGGEIEYRPLAQLLEFGRGYMTRIIIEFNHVGEWHLVAGQTIVRNFPNGCGTFTQRAQVFFHEFGEATALYAESLGNTKVHLVTVTRLTLAQDLRLTVNPGSKTYSGSFKLGNAHTQLGISCRNFVKGDDTKTSISFLKLTSGLAHLDTVPLGPVDLEIEPLEGANLIRFLVDQRTMNAGGYEIEFVCRKQPTDEWTILRVAESQGICGTGCCLFPIRLHRRRNLCGRTFCPPRGVVSTRAMFPPMRSGFRSRKKSRNLFRAVPASFQLSLLLRGLGRCSMAASRLRSAVQGSGSGGALRSCPDRCDWSLRKSH